MEVNFTPEQEAQLAKVAMKAGIDAERLVKDAALRLVEATPGSGPGPLAARPDAGLPVWHLGGAGPLHRRDLYDDAR